MWLASVRHIVSIMETKVFVVLEWLSHWLYRLYADSRLMLRSSDDNDKEEELLDTIEVVNCVDRASAELFLIDMEIFLGAGFSVERLVQFATSQCMVLLQTSSPDQKFDIIEWYLSFLLCTVDQGALMKKGEQVHLAAQDSPVSQIIKGTLIAILSNQLGAPLFQWTIADHLDDMVQSYIKEEKGVLSARLCAAWREHGISYFASMTADEEKTVSEQSMPSRIEVWLEKRVKETGTQCREIFDEFWRLVCPTGRVIDDYDAVTITANEVFLLERLFDKKHMSLPQRTNEKRSRGKGPKQSQKRGGSLRVADARFFVSLMLNCIEQHALDILEEDEKVVSEPQRDTNKSPPTVKKKKKKKNRGKSRDRSPHHRLFSQSLPQITAQKVNEVERLSATKETEPPFPCASIVSSSSLGESVQVLPSDNKEEPVCSPVSAASPILAAATASDVSAPDAVSVREHAVDLSLLTAVPPEEEQSCAVFSMSVSSALLSPTARPWSPSLRQSPGEESAETHAPNDIDFSICVDPSEMTCLLQQSLCDWGTGVTYRAAVDEAYAQYRFQGEGESLPIDVTISNIFHPAYRWGVWSLDALRIPLKFQQDQLVLYPVELDPLFFPGTAHREGWQSRLDSLGPKLLEAVRDELVPLYQNALFLKLYQNLERALIDMRAGSLDPFLRLKGSVLHRLFVLHSGGLLGANALLINPQSRDDEVQHRAQKLSRFVPGLMASPTLFNQPASAVVADPAARIRR